MAQNVDIDIDQVLKDVYFNPAHPASFSSLHALYESVKNQGISKKVVKEWLEKQEVYTLHKRVNRKIKRPRVIVPYKDYQWDGDTMNMVEYKEENKDFSYILVLIDIFTRFVWTAPLKTLRAKEMVTTLKTILPNTHPERIRTDKGSEFINRDVKRYLSSLNVILFHTTNEVKANYAERAIRSIKTRLTRFMHKNQTPRWLKALPDVTKAYNHAIHRGIKMSPTEARNADRIDLWNNQYSVKNPRITIKHPPKNKILFKFEVNDRVRLSGFRSPFERAYTEKWTHEIYTITERESRQGIALYSLKAWDNEEIEGKFYTNELQKVSAEAEIEYNIEKVVKEKKEKGKEGYIVKWYGWPERYNSWVPISDVKDTTFAPPLPKNVIPKKKKKKKKRK